MKVYIVIGDRHDAPLGIYTDPTEARCNDEIKVHTKGYECIREFYSETNDATYIDYEQKTTCEYGAITNRKADAIYTMETS